MAKAKKAAAAKKSPVKDLGLLVVSSKVKKKAKEDHPDIRFGKDAKEELSHQVGRVIEQAVEIAVSDGVGTVKERHIGAAMKKLYGAPSVG